MVNHVIHGDPIRRIDVVLDREKHARALGEGDRTAKATDLKEVQRVVGDYNGYSVMESYPSRSSAWTVTILGRP